MEKKFLSHFSVVLFARSRVPEVSWTRGVLPPSSLLMLPSPHEFPPEPDRAERTSPQMPLVGQDSRFALGLAYAIRDACIARHTPRHRLLGGSRTAGDHGQVWTCKTS